MYDKYFVANPITIGSKLPKHKGILFSGATATTPAISLHLVNNNGNTFVASLNVNLSPYIFPMQVYAVPSSLPTGVTAYHLS